MASLLHGVPIFAGLSQDALQLLLRKTERHEVAPGALVVREGESSNRLYLIESGTLRVCKNAEAPSEVELARLGAKDFFGEMCILETRPRAASVQAVTPCVLLSLSSMAFHHLYEEMPSEYGILILNIARDLSRRLRRIDELFAAKS